MLGEAETSREGPRSTGSKPSIKTKRDDAKLRLPCCGGGSQVKSNSERDKVQATQLKRIRSQDREGSSSSTTKQSGHKMAKNINSFFFRSIKVIFYYTGTMLHILKIFFFK